MILLQPIYGHNDARTGAETRQRRATDPRAARRARASRLRYRQANRRALRRHDHVSYHLVVSNPLSPRIEGAGRGPLGGESRSTPPPLLPFDARRARRARAAAIDLAELRKGDQSRGGDQACVTLRQAQGKISCVTSNWPSRAPRSIATFSKSSGSTLNPPMP